MKENFTKDARELWVISEKAAAEMGHHFVSPEHVLLAFFESGNNPANLVMDEFIGNLGKLKSRVMEMLNHDEINQAATEQLLKRAQREANLFLSTSIDVSHLMVAVFGDYHKQKNVPAKVIQSFGIDIDWFLKLIKYPKSLKKDITRKTAVTGSVFTAQKENNGSRAIPSALEKYGRDLAALIQSQKLDPVALREKEIDDIIEILCRRVKSNPILVGEPGVGKSALMVGLVQRIINGNIPEKLKNTRIFELNLTSVIAGASLQGEFEKRMSNIINYIKQEKNIILFIDEIHNIAGTGGNAGLGDAANILKAPLINGDIKCIGATTLKEYRKHIERDPALARRFQTVMIEEPSVEETVKIINSVKYLYEDFHNVIIPDDVIQKTVELAVIHIKDQFLPDKAIDLIDQACAHVSLSVAGDENRVVSLKDIAHVLSHKTKIPLEKLSCDKFEKLLLLETLLKKRIIGQDEAVDKVCDIIRLTKSSLDLKPVRPDGVFLFIGPTGVGKTEMARVLAEILFDDQNKMIRLDMSEYMEPHSVSKIIGSPPGYIGSDQEGGLTGKVRTEPYSIILLDEVEKAHPEVLNIFLQVFEDGMLTDSQGRKVYFSNCTIVMTSNIGVSTAFSRSRGIGFNDCHAEIDFRRTEKSLRESVKKYFTPEFLNRIDEIIYFKPLDKEAIKRIARMKLDEIRQRFKEEDKEIVIDDEVLSLVSEQGYNPEYGARFLNRTIEDLVLKPLSKLVLANRKETNFSVFIGPAGEVRISMRGEIER